MAGDGAAVEGCAAVTTADGHVRLGEVGFFRLPVEDDLWARHSGKMIDSWELWMIRMDSGYVVGPG